MNIPMNNSVDVSTTIDTVKSTKEKDEESLRVVAAAFEKMVFDQAFSFTPIAKGEMSKLGYAQDNSIVNDLFKEELHNQSKGMLMDMFIKQM